MSKIIIPDQELTFRTADKDLIFNALNEVKVCFDDDLIKCKREGEILYKIKILRTIYQFTAKQDYLCDKLIDTLNDLEIEFEQE